MDFVALEDVTVRLGRPVTDEAEAARIAAYIEDATALVLDWCRSDSVRHMTESFALVLRQVVCAEVIRWLAVSPGTVAEKTGELEVQYTPAATNSGLSEAAKDSLKRYRKRATTLPLRRARAGWPDGGEAAWLSSTTP